MDAPFLCGYIHLELREVGFGMMSGRYRLGNALQLKLAKRCRELAWRDGDQYVCFGLLETSLEKETVRNPFRRF